MTYDEDLAARIRAALSFEPDVTERHMFGGCAFLLGGHMVGAASGSGGLMLRVDPAAAGPLLAAVGVLPVVMKGRPLNGWLHVAEEQLQTEAALRDWLDHGLAFVRTLPAK